MQQENEDINELEGDIDQYSTQVNRRIDDMVSRNDR